MPARSLYREPHACDVGSISRSSRPARADPEPFAEPVERGLAVVLVAETRLLTSVLGSVRPARLLI